MFVERISEGSVERRLRAVDGLRTLAFFVVVLCHFGGMIGPGFPIESLARQVTDALARAGSVGTDSFFFLAAFLLCRSLRKGSSWKEAVGRRFFKFYPGFLAILTLYLLLSPLAPSYSKLPTDGATLLVYVVANLLLLPGLIPITPIVTVAWSLSYVGVGYVLVGGLFRLADSRRYSARQRCGLWAAAAFAIWTATWFPSFTYERFLFFPLGGLCAELMPKIHRLGSHWWLAALAGLGLAFLGSDGLSMRAAGIALLVAGALAAPEIQSGIVNNLIAYLGQYSYAVFLSHGLALHLIQVADPVRETLIDLFALLLGGLSLVLVVAIAFRTIVLEPLRAMLMHRPSGDRIPAR